MASQAGVSDKDDKKKSPSSARKNTMTPSNPGGSYAHSKATTPENAEVAKLLTMEIRKKLPPFQKDNYKRSAGRNQKPKTTLSDGKEYEGEWNDKGMRDGFGTCQWPDGSYYEGHFENDKACGEGRLIGAGGYIYEGQWADDKAHGHGIYTCTDGSKYEGYWIVDKQHGKGKETWPDGA